MKWVERNSETARVNHVDSVHRSSYDHHIHLTSASTRLVTELQEIQISALQARSTYFQLKYILQITSLMHNATLSSKCSYPSFTSNVLRMFCRRSSPTLSTSATFPGTKIQYKILLTIRQNLQAQSFPLHAYFPFLFLVKRLAFSMGNFTLVLILHSQN